MQECKYGTGASWSWIHHTEGSRSGGLEGRCACWVGYIIWRASAGVEVWRSRMQEWKYGGAASWSWAHGRLVPACMATIKTTTQNTPPNQPIRQAFCVHLCKPAAVCHLPVAAGALAEAPRSGFPHPTLPRVSLNTLSLLLLSQPPLAAVLDCLVLCVCHALQPRTCSCTAAASS
jgi:hypothetical protein